MIATLTSFTAADPVLAARGQHALLPSSVEDGIDQRGRALAGCTRSRAPAVRAARSAAFMLGDSVDAVMGPLFLFRKVESLSQQSPAFVRHSDSLRARV
jgi:hypothetical protein